MRVVLYARAPLAARRADGNRGQEQAELPQQLAPAQAELGQGADRDQVLGGLARHTRAAQQVGQRPIRPMRVAFGDDGFGQVVANPAYGAQAEDERAARGGGRLDRNGFAAAGAAVDPGPQHLQLVPPGIADQHVRRVKAHRRLFNSAA